MFNVNVNDVCYELERRECRRGSNSRADFIKLRIRREPLLDEVCGRNHELGIVFDIVEPEISDCFKHGRVERGPQ